MVVASSTPPAPAASPTAEQMIAAANIARMSRGWNGLNTGGTYDEAINQLSDAEKMSLSTVSVGKQFL